MDKTLVKELNADECRELVLKFNQEQKNFKLFQETFNSLKNEFNSKMEKYFKSNEIDTSIYFNSDEDVDEKVFVRRIQRKSITFNPDKLDKKLPKEVKSSVILKQYEIIDFDGLVSYLKECGVDPKVFKSFVNVIKQVDTNELERLEAIGEVSEDLLDGCFEITKQKPFFTVVAKKGQGDND